VCVRERESEREKERERDKEREREASLQMFSESCYCRMLTKIVILAQKIRAS